MPPKQSTLGKFFSNPHGTKVAPKQSKLVISSKAPSIPSTKNKDEVTQDGLLSLETKHKVKKVQSDARMQSPKLESKKRSRSPTPKFGVKQELEDEEDEEDEEPVLKRHRFTKRGHDIEQSSPKEEVSKGSNSRASCQSPKIMKVVKEEEKDDDNVDPTLRNSERRSFSASASTPEIEEDLDERIDDDDEKSEVAEKAREKIQKTLEAKTKDPYPDWKSAEPVPYAALCTTFSLIEMTSKRLIIASHCSLFLRQILRLTPSDLLPTVLLMINKLAADYAGIELGIGESLIMKAIGESTGRSLAVVKEDQKEIGDLGLVAVKSRAKQPTMFKPKPLTVRGVHKSLIDIATMSGNGAQSRKVDIIKKLLSAADGSMTENIDITRDKGGASEAKFLVRFLEGKLRLGLAEKTVIVALAQAMVCHEIEATGKVPTSEQLAKGESILKAVYSSLPSYDVIIPAMLEHGIFHLRDKCKLQPGVPLKPMLAKPTKAITEVLDRFENQTFTCEYKYDGERAQIHYVSSDSSVHYSGSAAPTARGLAAIFSRNSEDLSKKYPDILAKLDTWVKPDTQSFVLDCESVAWDVVDKKVLPFQQLMTRKKKDVRVEDVKVKVCVFAFDLLFFNGEAIVEKSLRERRQLLHSAFTPIEGEFALATYMDSQELDDIQHFLDESVKASCEGLMVKMLDGSESGYEPSKRSRNWLKIKKDYLSGIGDSLDLIVLGAYYGKGKRTSVYGAFLLGCCNANTGHYESICNIGTGFSETQLAELHAQLSETIIDRPKPFYDHAATAAHQPDVWFDARFVWEVKTADLTLSPRYQAGSTVFAQAKGVSLRFPRFVRVREDKLPHMATTSAQVVEMYRSQESVSKNVGPSVDDDFEY